MKGQQLCMEKLLGKDNYSEWFHSNSVGLMIFWGHPSKVWNREQLSFCWLLKLSYGRGLLRKKFKNL